MSVTEDPWQILLFPVIPAAGGGETEMVIVAVSLQDPEVVITVYVVVADGVTTVEEDVALLLQV